MTVYEINIKEKKKFIKQLTFKQLDEEVYNFMYKKTILEQSRENLSFQLLIYFLIIKDNNGNSLAYSIFSNYLGKVNDLNKEFSKKKGNLDGGDYANIKEEKGLTNVFKYDIFFYLIKIFSNTTELELSYNDILKNDTYFTLEIKKINDKFGSDISKTFYEFYGYKINDTREDDLGNIHDLSKSVYHTIMMRMSRRMDLTLAYRTDIKSITSKSPLDITLLQYIDPKIIFDIWDRFSLTDYILNIGIQISNNSLVASTIGGILSQIVYKKIEIRKLDKRKGDDKNKIKKLEDEIKKLRKDFDQHKDSIAISLPIERNIENASKNLENLIKDQEEKIQNLEKSSQNSKIEVEELKKEIEKLKNIEVTTNIFNIQGSVGKLQNLTKNSSQDNNY